MTDKLRRFYNRIERFFDRGALSKVIRISKQLEGPAEAKTAKAVLNSIIKTVKRFDRDAKLKIIVSPDGVDSNGFSSRWEFFFDLPKRQAKMVCDWHIHTSDNNIIFEQIDVTVSPFPPADNVLRQMVDAGKLLYSQMKGMWRKELGRTPDIHFSFTDSNVAVMHFIKSGLCIPDMEYSLSTGIDPEGCLSWIAQTRDRKIYAKLV